MNVTVSLTETQIRMVIPYLVPVLFFLLYKVHKLIERYYKGDLFDLYCESIIIVLTLAILTFIFDMVIFGPNSILSIKQAATGFPPALLTTLVGRKFFQ